MATPLAKTSEIKRIDLTEFRKLGLLQELNRRFLHPLGLALEIIVEADGTVTGFGGVWDYRDDPEGMGYAEGLIDPAAIARVDAMIEEKRDARTALYGGVIQGPGQ